MSNNKTSLLYWFPKVVELGIPVPNTICIRADAMMILGAMEGENQLDQEFMSDLRSAADRIGFPVFLRTDLQSGKHGWKNTCFVPDASRLQSNMFGVAEENELGSCFFGEHYVAFVIREFLDLDTSFIAFYGDMPINRERRYFVEDGAILCHHPYWPAESIEGHTGDPEWMAKLDALNDESLDEIALLSGYALRVSAALDGCWSVDFAKTKDGAWYLIDMAVGSDSFHWKDCPNRSIQVHRSMLPIGKAEISG